MPPAALCAMLPLLFPSAVMFTRPKIGLEIKSCIAFHLSLIQSKPSVKLDFKPLINCCAASVGLSHKVMNHCRTVSQFAINPVPAAMIQPIGPVTNIKNLAVGLSHKFTKKFFTVSQLLYNATPAAIRPPIAKTSRPIGLAFMAAFHAHCAAVTAVVAAVLASVAAAIAVKRIILMPRRPADSAPFQAHCATAPAVVATL